ncbi:hypothetical protein [Almyronema epifaneia]|uniref:Uncharacterized protein n=1 Tax=Almyronema epifaneia S1 TaxID=2991925 RepID=A0ABW6I902_9CYAN
MLWKLYFVLAIATFLISLQAFLTDASVSKADWRYWCFLLLVALFAPITLPSIVNQKIRRGLRRVSSKRSSDNPRSSFDLKSLTRLR